MSEEKNILQFDLSSKQIKYREILDRDFVELEVYRSKSQRLTFYL